MQNNSSDKKHPFNILPFSFYFIVILLVISGHFVADVYLPSLPSIADEFQGTNAHLQFTITIYILCYSLGQLIYGPLSDRYGRRLPIMAGIVLIIVGSLICVSAHSTKHLFVGRIFQGLGTASAYVVGRAIFRDLFSGKELARLGSITSMLSSMILAGAPTLGGYLHYFFGWRSTFWFLTGFAVLLGSLVWFRLPETNKFKDPNATKLSVLVTNYKMFLTDRTFWAYTICVGCVYGGIMAYITVAPFILQDIVGLTPVQYGWLGFVIAGSLATGSFTNSRLVLKHPPRQLILCGIALMFIAGSSMLTFGLLHIINLWVILIPAGIFMCAGGFVFGNSFSGALSPFPRTAGLGVAIFGCLQIFSGAITSAVMAIVPEVNQLPLAICFLCLAFIALFAMLVVIEHK